MPGSVTPMPWDGKRMYGRDTGKIYALLCVVAIFGNVGTTLLLGVLTGLLHLLVHIAPLPSVSPS